MTPLIPGYYIDRIVRIRGTDVHLRYFTTNNSFVIDTGKPLTMAEKLVYAKYMCHEGFFDNPVTGAQATNWTIS